MKVRWKILISPLEDFDKSRRHLLKSAELELDRSASYADYARTVWFEYRWRLKNDQVDCRKLSTQVEIILSHLKSTSHQPYLRSYFVRLLLLLPKNHTCNQWPGLAQKQWQLLNIEHAIIASKINGLNFQ